MAWVVYYRDAHRRRHARAFDTQQAALDYQAQMRLESRQSTRACIDPEVRFKTYTERWLALKGPTLKETTLADYRHRLRLHIVPELGGIKVRDLERGRIHELLADKVASGLNRKTVRRILANIHSILEHAKHDGVIASNPASGLAKFAGLTQTREEQQEEIRAFTREELGRFLDAASTKRPEFWIVAFFGSRTGTRLGEVLGCRWSDIDTAARTIRLQRALTPKGKAVTLKTKAARTVELGRAVFEALRSHKATLQAQTLARGEKWSEVSPIFPPVAGARVTHSSVNVAFKACLKAAGLPGHFSYHSLRHTFASVHLSEGTHLQWVSQQLGHTDARTTATVYGRWLKAKSPGAADALDSTSWQQKGNTEPAAAVGAGAADAKLLEGQEGSGAPQRIRTSDLQIRSSEPSNRHHLSPTESETDPDEEAP